MSVLVRMKLKNKIADMWIGHALLAGNLNLCSADFNLTDYRTLIRLSITLSPRSEGSSEIRRWHVPSLVINRDRLQTLILGLSRPQQFRHKPELRSYAFLIYEQQVNLLLSYLTVDKAASAGFN